MASFRRARANLERVVPEGDPMITGFSGSIIIADFPNLDDAQTWVNAEPYLAQGVYAQVDIRPYRETYGHTVTN